jgi:nicotinate (nicotinamide) nucleotide adenylyltransferase
MYKSKLLKKMAQHFSLLYVEDNQGLRESSKGIFNSLFKYTEVAEDGEIGITLYDKYFQSSGNNFDIVISDIEQRAALKPSYSLKILKLLEKEFPDDTLQLLIGGDSLAALHSWYKAHEIVAKYEIICYPRKGYNVKRKSLLKHWTSKEIDILLKTILQMPFFDISSTSVRNNITDKIISKNIKENILKYIKNKGLYL